MTNKMTKKDYFTTLMNIVSTSNATNKEKMLEFITHEIELLDNKAPSKKQIEAKEANVAIMNAIVEVLKRLGNAVTVSQLMNEPELNGYSNQKLSALLRQLVKANRVTKVTDKRKSYFSV